MPCSNSHSVVVTDVLSTNSVLLSIRISKTVKTDKDL